MALAVIGAGFGRTGTASLQRALEILGFGPCYHMFEIRRQPRRAPAWRHAVRDGTADWDAIFAGYRSAVDWPACRFYKELAAAYPEARVILTTRDAESWHGSCMSTIYAVAQAMPWLLKLVPVARHVRAMLFEAIWDGTFDGRFADAAHARAVFEAHNDEVRRTIPPERLLVFEVHEGWQPLCQFLGVDEPDEPFPQLNEGPELEQLARTIRARVRVATVVAGIVALAALYQVIAQQIG
jgi:hypothetical protein